MKRLLKKSLKFFLISYALASVTFVSILLASYVNTGLFFLTRQGLFAVLETVGEVKRVCDQSGTEK